MQVQVRDNRWKFSVAVLLPVIAAVLVTVTLAAGFVIWSAQRTDDHSLERQNALVAKVIENMKSDFGGTQGTVVLRYETAEAFIGEDGPDLDWIDSEMGDGEYSDFSHNRVYVLDPKLDPIYAAKEGTSVDVAAYDHDRAVIDPLAVKFRAPAMQAEIKTYEDGDSDWPPQVTDVVKLDGRVALASVMPVVSNWSGQEQKKDHYYYHVQIQFVDSDLASDLTDQYLINGIHIDAVPNTLPGEAMVPIANDSGRFVAYLKFKPERPGQDLLHETLPASLGLLAVIALVIGLLLFGLARSTKALEKARAEALHRATHDPLTGLANRALFSEKLERSPLPLTLLALDLDRFKAVNDTLGHEAGDDLLKQVAARLTPIVRPTDIVARLGGDEFMILLTGAIEPERVQAIAAEIVEAMATPFRIGRDTANIGVSVGIATALNDERSDLVSRADFALYDAKESGRNTFKIFDELKKAA